MTKEEYLEKQVKLLSKQNKFLLEIVSYIYQDHTVLFRKVKGFQPRILKLKKQQSLLDQKMAMGG